LPGLGGRDGAERVYGTPVSANYFTVLGITAHVGRSVELHEQMSIGREDELDVVFRRAEVALHLVQTVSGRQRVFLGLE